MIFRKAKYSFKLFLCLFACLSIFLLNRSFVYGQTSVLNDKGVIDLVTTNGIIKTIVRSGDIMYIGGNFSQIQTLGATPSAYIARKNIAAYDTLKNEILSWDPQPNGAVESIGLDDTTIYVSGSFSTISGAPRSQIAALDKNTGNLTNWAPVINGNVYTLAMDVERLYIGGSFTKVNNQDIKHLAMFKKSTGELLSNSFNINNTIASITLNDKYLYIGGAFTKVNEQVRMYLASIDKASLQLTPWTPHVQEMVRSIFLNGTTVYVEGYFTNEKSIRYNFNHVYDEVTGRLLNYKAYQVATPVIVKESNNSSTQTSYLVTREDIDVFITPSQSSGNASISIDSHNDTEGGLLLDQKKLGFKIPSLADILTFVIRIFFVIAGLAALIFMLLGAFAWITSGGDKEAIDGARQKIQAAVIGLIMIIVVLALIWTLETIVFRRAICLGISCPMTIPGLIKPTN